MPKICYYDPLPEGILNYRLSIKLRLESWICRGQKSDIKKSKYTSQYLGLSIFVYNKQLIKRCKHLYNITPPPVCFDSFKKLIFRVFNFYYYSVLEMLWKQWKCAKNERFYVCFLTWFGVGFGRFDRFSKSNFWLINLINL